MGTGTAYRTFWTDTQYGFRVGTPQLTYMNASVNNGALKCLFFEGQSAARRIYQNDPATAAASSADATTPTMSGAFYLGGGIAGFIDGSVKDVGFFANSQAIRERLKAWGEAQGDVYG
jgi:hypothetical protein